jgi:hypothetical protein
VAVTREEYHTLNPLFPCSDPIPVVSSLKKNVFILFGVLIGIFLISTIVLASLFSIEKTKTISRTTSKNLIYALILFIIHLVENNLCLTPFCVKAGL